MSKIEQLQEKITNDYKAYRDKALSVDKETLLNNSYYNAICGEWECYLDAWLDDGVFEENFGESKIDTLLATDNIFDFLVDYVGGFDTVDFNMEAFYRYLEDM